MFSGDGELCRPAKTYRLEPAHFDEVYGQRVGGMPYQLTPEDHQRP